MSHLTEINFDGLVGLTHNYAGLSFGNVASECNVGAVSRPRDAALQGLAKMRELMELGLVQGVIPPQERPHVPTLRGLGFSGSDEQIIEKVAKQDAILLAQVTSASSMWTANAATVTPSCDTLDGKLHMTAANLRSMMHRYIEGPQTARILRSIFGDKDLFLVHDPVLAADALGDEGAANHTRLFDDTDPGAAATHFFVYGVHHAHKAGRKPAKFPARQSLEASQAIARIHGLPPEKCIYWQQNPDAIDAGAFHNDVVSVGAGRVMLYHEQAYVDEAGLINALGESVGPNFVPVRIDAEHVPLTLAVQTYLFNSQLVILPDSSYVLIAPTESQQAAAVKAEIDRVIADKSNPISRVIYKNLRESMRNGGGPACLRLRVPVSAQELSAINPACIMNAAQLSNLESWVRRHYPETLKPGEIADPQLLHRSRHALDELSRILKLGNIYEFQKQVSSQR